MSMSRCSAAWWNLAVALKGLARTAALGAVFGLASLVVSGTESSAQDEPASETPAPTADPSAAQAETTEPASTESGTTEPAAQESTPETTTEPATQEPATPEAPPQVPLPHPFDQVMNSPPKHDLVPYSPVEEEAARKEFEQSSARLREILKRLFDVKNEFTFAADRDTLTDSQLEWANLKLEGEKVFLRMQDLAARLFVTDPNREGLMFRMVVDAILEDAEQGRMWTCYRNIVLARRTVGLDESMDPIAAVAAFRCCQFEEFLNYVELTDPTKLDDKHKEVISMFDYVVQAWQIELPIRQAEALADDLPRVRMTTTMGVVELELFENEAPNTVANFIELVESGFYTDIPFHRVLAGFMAQAGEPQGIAPEFRIPCECYQENHRRHFMGSLSMALAGKDTGSSQFFIAYGPQPHLDGQHTVFGRVISGMEAVERLARINPEELKGNEIPDVILKMEVIRKRDHEYVPQRLPMQ